MIRLATDDICYSRKQTQLFLGYGYAKPEAELALIEACEKELLPKLSYVAVAEKYSISFDGETLNLGFCKVKSLSLARNLSGCEAVYLLACTVGSLPDMLIKKYGVTSSAKAVIMQAVGASAAECWCEEVNNRLTAQADKDGYVTRPRFSFGYGDTPLSLQRQVFDALSVEKRLGITLTEGFMMYPTKSITAVIGLKRK